MIQLGLLTCTTTPVAPLGRWVLATWLVHARNANCEEAQTLENKPLRRSISSEADPSGMRFQQIHNDRIIQRTFLIALILI